MARVAIVVQRALSSSLRGIVLLWALLLLFAGHGVGAGHRFCLLVWAPAILDIATGGRCVARF